MVNNNIIHINNRLLLWHREGNMKLNLSCTFRYSTTGSPSQSLRIKPSNQRVCFCAQAREVEGGWVLFCYSQTEILVFRKGVMYLVLALLSSSNYIIIIYSLNLLTSRCPNTDLSFLWRQCTLWRVTQLLPAAKLEHTQC